MHFSSRLYLSLTAILATTSALPAKRQGTPVIESPGSIVTPSDGTSVSPGHSFPLSVAVPEWNHCHPGYTPVSVWLLADTPTTSSLNSTYQFSDYLYYYGDYLVNNFPGMFSVHEHHSTFIYLFFLGELPNMGTPPPSSLTTPDLGASFNGQDIYLAVIEIIGGCPVSLSLSTASLRCLIIDTLA
jgi:hypothetical protein